MITVFGRGVTLEELANIDPVRPKNAGSRWRPIHHHDLALAVRDEVVGRGWDVVEEKYTTARDGADMAGALGIRPKGGDGLALLPPGMTLGLGFIHSNARRRALTLTVGSTVTCCTNGMCTGTLLLRRPHDGTVSLYDEVEQALDRYAEASHQITATVRGLQEAELSPAQASLALMEAGHRKLVGWAAIGRVHSEYRNPTFAEHGTGTSWALLNAFTYAARRNIHPVRQMETYNQFRELLPCAMAA